MPELITELMPKISFVCRFGTFMNVFLSSNSFAPSRALFVAMRYFSYGAYFHFLGHFTCDSLLLLIFALIFFVPVLLSFGSHCFCPRLLTRSVSAWFGWTPPGIQLRYFGIYHPGLCSGQFHSFCLVFFLDAITSLAQTWSVGWSVTCVFLESVILDSVFFEVYF